MLRLLYIQALKGGRKEIHAVREGRAKCEVEKSLGKVIDGVIEVSFKLQREETQGEVIY